MADIQYDEEQEYQRPIQSEQQKPLFVRLVLATGIISSDKQAEYALLGISTVLLLIAIFIPIFLNRQSAPALPPGASVINIPGQPPRLLTPIPGR